MPQSIAIAAKLSNRICTVLEQLSAPINAVDLFDKPEIRELCTDRGKVSATLSDMWRSGRLNRYPCVLAGSSVRYAYELLAEFKSGRSVEKVPKVKVEAPLVKDKPHITVTDHLVTIELATIKITVEV
jgi:hypothetical protein